MRCRHVQGRIFHLLFCDQHQLPSRATQSQMHTEGMFLAILVSIEGLILLYQIYHPNVDLEGNVCLNILREDWKPVLNLNSVMVGLQYLFLEPNADDPLNKGTLTNHAFVLYLGLLMHAVQRPRKNYVVTESSSPITSDKRCVETPLGASSMTGSPLCSITIYHKGLTQPLSLLPHFNSPLTPSDDSDRHV